STFGGNPLACAAALATLDAIADDGLMDRAIQVGDEIRAGIAEALKGVSGVVDIRGRGLMIGIELDRPCGELVSRGLEAGVLFNVTAERVVRLLPPLIFTSVDAQALVDVLAPLIRDFLSQ
ncbi:MAG: aspartate aminotransferase family protein, partial [Betaproteobacteria bacterium HGW-Betaproteobacteria-21]